MRAGGHLHGPSSQGPPGAPECSPEAENSNDNDHQDQHHTHDCRACDQGQLLPPALGLWGRKAAIRRSRRALGTLHQPQGMSCAPLRTGPRRCGRCGKAQWFPNCFPPARAPPKSLRAREEVSQPRYSESGFDFVQLYILVAHGRPQGLKMKRSVAKTWK